MSVQIDYQLKQNDCGISAVKTICNIMEVNIAREVIEDEILLTQEGASLGSINQFLRDYGFATKFELLDINSVNGDYEELKQYLPCITPIKKAHTLHYVVIKDVYRNKLRILDPSERKEYFWSIQDFKSRAYFSSSLIEYVELEQVLKVHLKEELTKKQIKLPPHLSNNEILTWFNKFTYFNYIQENYGFSSADAAGLFLKDLLFHQDIAQIPDHFRSLVLKNKRELEIKAPVLLSIKSSETAKELPLPSVNIYWRLFKEIADFHSLWYIFLATMVIGSMLSYMSVFINQILIDHIIPSYNIKMLYVFAIGVGVFEVVKIIFRIYRKFISIHLSNSLNKYFLKAFDEKLNRFSIRYLQGFRRGDLTERLSDARKVKSFFTSSFINMVVDSITGTISLIVLIFMSWKLAVFTLFILSLYLGLFFIFTPIIERIEKERHIIKANYFSKFLEKMEGIQVIKAMNLENYSSQQIHKRIDDLINIGTKSKYYGLLNSVLSSLISVFSSLFILIFASREMIVNGSMSLGMIITFSTLAGMVIGSFSSLISQNLDLQEYKIILNRFFDFEENKVSQTVDDNSSEQTAQRGHSLAKAKGVPYSKIQKVDFKTLRLKNIAFSYNKVDYVLKDANMTIKKGQKIYIEGGNGAGKSTFCKIIGLLYQPDKGEMLLNGINADMYEEKVLRKKVLYISSDDTIFNESLLFNITFGRKVDMVRLIEFAKVLSFYEFIMNKANKFNHTIHENGKNLSTGQKKKLLLLRAFMAEAELIIFDEIFNGMDRRSKKNAETIIDFMQDKTIIIISHIPSNVIKFHQKYNLSNGVLSKSST